MARPLAFTEKTYEKMSLIANTYGIEPVIIDAIITIESAWNPFAVRYEPAFKYTQECEKHAKANAITPSTEERLQMFSFGLMQIMGGTARAFSYTGNLLKLTDVAINIDLGCKIIEKLMKRYDDLNDVVAAYNGGSVRKNAAGNYYNQQYVNNFNLIYQGLPYLGLPLTHFSPEK